MNNELPKNWEEVFFTDVFDINGGSQPPKTNFIYESKENYIRLLQIRDFGDRPVPTYIPNEKHLRTCKKDDILIARYGASIGRIVTGMEGAYNVALAKVSIPHLIDRKYAYWILKSNLFQDPITSFQRTAQNGFNKNDLSGITIPIAPLNEQKRIASKLDAINAHLEFIKEKLDNFPKLLKEFRESILSQAVIGKLTKSKFKTKTIGELQVFIGSGITPKGGSTIYKTKGIPFIRSMNVYPEGIVWEGMAFVDEKLNEKMKRTYIKEKDVLLNITGASIGRSTFIPVGFGKANVNQHVCIIRVNDLILPEYLSYYLNSPIGQELIMSSQSGMTRQGLNYTQIKSIPVALPSIKEQLNIINRTKYLFDIISDIEKTYEQLKVQIKNLPQATLSKAFNGQLVPQDKNDESAKVLLEKIKGDKVKVVQSAKINQVAKIKLKIKSITKNKIVVMDKNLIAVLKKKFGDKSFSFEEMDAILNHNSKDEYIKTKKVLFELLRNAKYKKKESRIISKVDSISGTIKFKLIEA